MNQTAGGPVSVSARNRTVERLLFLLLFTGSAILIFFHLGSNSLHNGDEAKFAFISKEMLHNHDFITPKIENEPYFGKPPLRFWLNAILFSLFGASEWTIR